MIVGWTDKLIGWAFNMRVWIIRLKLRASRGLGVGLCIVVWLCVWAYVMYVTTQYDQIIMIKYVHIFTQFSNVLPTIA